MGKATRDIGKERKPRPEQPGTPVLVRLQPPELAELDAWIAEHDDPQPSRPEALRRLAQFALRRKHDAK